MTAPRVRARKRPHSGPMSEDVIQRNVAAHIRARGVENMIWCHVPNGGSRHKLEAAKLKAMGTTAGWPDLQFFFKGHSYFLELKTERGRVSPKQKQVIAELGLCGATCAVAFGLDAALKQLEDWGLIR